MGLKRRLAVGIGSVILFSIAFVVIYSITLKKEDDYNTKLISVLKEQENVTVKDVFSFEFDRAYIFNDSYISGEGFAERYNLDISVSEVETGASEQFQRIVFVDECGDFVYEYKCNVSDVIILEKGIIIYPETTIERKSSGVEKLAINFQSIDRYDS